MSAVLRLRTLKLEELMEQQVIDKETTEEARRSLETPCAIEIWKRLPLQINRT